MSKTKCILVIDDDQDILAQAKAVLEAAGYEVLTAGSGQEGLAVLETRAPDIILCDMMMERIDEGLLVCHETRARGLRIPVYLISDIGDLSNQNFDVMAEGFSGALQKPVSAAELRDLVR